MAHTIRDKRRLLNRVRRIRGQIAAVEKAGGKVILPAGRAKEPKPEDTAPA